MKTIEGIKLLLEGSNCIAASQKAGMVYQVWEDGEITLQKIKIMDKIKEYFSRIDISNSLLGSMNNPRAV